MNVLFTLFSIFFLMGLIEAQNMTIPTDILQSMKNSFEAAGAGSINLGPMGVLGSLTGQFGVKINKEQSSPASPAKLVRNNKRSISALNSPEGKLMKKIDTNSRKVYGLNSTKNMKNCFGYPIYIPVVRIVATTTPTTTTAGAPDARGDSTTTVAA